MVKRINFEGIWEKHLRGLIPKEFYTAKLWRARKKWLALTANLTCQDCEVKVENWRDLEPHHIKYNCDYGLDQPEDFAIVCHSCHEKRHGRKLNYLKKQYTTTERDLVYRKKVDRENALRAEKLAEFRRKNKKQV